VSQTVAKTRLVNQKGIRAIHPRVPVSPPNHRAIPPSQNPKESHSALNAPPRNRARKRNAEMRQ